MTRGSTAIVHRFLTSTRGLAAVEYALVMPVLALMFLGSYDAANAIALYMKVRVATYSLAAITNQYGIGNASISSSTMTAITSATTAVLSPYSSSPSGVVISQIKATTNKKATVSWSYATGSGVALTQGSSFTLPTNFAKDTCGGSYPCYFIYAQVQYAYTPAFSAFMTGPLTLSDSLYTTPRISACVQYNSVPSSC